MRIIPFEALHVELLDDQEHNKPLRPFITAKDVRALEGPHAYTGVVDGRVVVCAGVEPMWQGRGYAWSYLSAGSGAHFVAIHKAVKRFLEIAPFVRVEASVVCEFEQGHRWARMLGFNLEAERMISYGPDGRDYALYARVKNG